MMKGKTILLILAALLFSAPMSYADTIELSLSNIWVDHYDTLIIDGENDTLQWLYQGTFTAVGLWPDLDLKTQEPTHVLIKQNGTTLMDTDWMPWDVMPEVGTSAFSSLLSIPDILPAMSELDSIVESHTGRGEVEFQSDMYAEYSVLLLSYFDPDSNADYYTTTLVFNYTPAVPVPAAFWLFGSGLFGLLGFRARTKN